MRTNNFIMWCVFDNNNNPVINTLHTSKSGSLSSFCNSKTWIYELKPKGYSLKPVFINIEQIV